ncbi:MAG: sel1 repeat family protein [Candidatus Thiothrix singaporensis]|uniref:Sel1 repeat family protein n=1 Tax=Candidatus Thiothrix singaporensis TaxID=2799669 RepID=A0A7L6APR9_9GAMM|nr:MAG: sel1 repeat family protein [Candidatus Thiothrix singaporensis]
MRSSDNPQANIAQSIKWQQSAAEAGNAEAQYGLGLLYANGQYVASDSNKAREWFQKAADQGYVAARLAMLSLNNGAPALAIASSGRLRNAAAEEQLASAPAPTPTPAPPENVPHLQARIRKSSLHYNWKQNHSLLRLPDSRA